jgi:Holliday junction resolvasome RuvABC endonuclease subunit
MWRTALSEKVFDGGLLQGEPVAIGIDQSLTGFAISAVNVNRPECYETWVYKSSYRGVQRLDDIGGWITEKLEFIQEQNAFIQDIAMEGTVLASHSALVLGELAALVKLTLWNYFKDYDHQDHLRTPLQIPPMTLKKYAAGKGNAKKQEMLMQIYKRWGVEFNDDNAADSYALGRLAAGVQIDAVEKAIVEQVKDVKYRDAVA